LPLARGPAHADPSRRRRARLRRGSSDGSGSRCAQQRVEHRAARGRPPSVALAQRSAQVAARALTGRLRTASSDTPCGTPISAVESSSKLAQLERRCCDRAESRSGHGSRSRDSLCHGLHLVGTSPRGSVILGSRARAPSRSRGRRSRPCATPEAPADRFEGHAARSRPREQRTSASLRKGKQQRREPAQRRGAHASCSTVLGP
jgi:hypothetical protein